MSEPTGGISDIEYGKINAKSKHIARGTHRFPEIKGLCRVCTRAHIVRRELSEVPAVFCTASEFGQASRMPLDIMECSLYSRRGDLRLDELADLAILVDPRELGGQYL